MQTRHKHGSWWWAGALGSRGSRGRVWPPGHSRARGYTLIELMAVVLIVALLSAVAYPAYTHHVRRAHRAEARTALLDAQQYMERYHAVYHRYTTQTDAAPVLPLRLRTVPEGVPVDTARYQLSVSEAQADTYMLKAVPAPGWDEACGSLTLTNTGVKGRTGTALPVPDCWR